MAREAMDIYLRVLKESNRSRFDSYSVRNSVSIEYHITFRDCRVHIFSYNLSRKSCINSVELLRTHTVFVKSRGRSPRDVVYLIFTLTYL